MQRRAFISCCAAAVFPTLVASAELTKRPRVGFLGAESPTSSGHFLDAFRSGMRELGYAEGQNLDIEQRWGEGRNERFPDLVAELVRLKADVIVAVSTPAAMAAKNGTKTVPIVIVAGDPFALGLVSSLARPGGNVTGVSLVQEQLAGKLLEQLKQVLPHLSHVAVLFNPTNPANVGYAKSLDTAAKQLRVKLLLQAVQVPDQIDTAVAAIAAAKAQALIVFTDPLTVRYRAQIVDLVAKHRLPAMYGFKEFVEAGGLMAYGVSVPDACRRAALYVDKILKGAKPADLPVEQATQLEFVINLKTAKVLGLTMPPSLLQRADQVIE
jgi:putative ABC transport system substrate-binding protein